MIASKHRFHGINSLNYVYRHGESLRSKHMIIKYCPNQRRDTYRIAVVVSRKVTKSAPKRNRIRRRIYEIFRTELAGHLQNFDIVVTVFDENLAIMSHEDLKTLLLNQVKSMIKQS